MEATNKTAAALFSDVPEPRNTRERILFGALDLFHGEGFHAVGLDSIIEHVGVTKTTFYNYFQSRDHLIREAIEVRDEWDQAAFARRLQELGGFVPRDMLIAMFDVLDEWFTGPKFRGCLFIHACAEFPSLQHQAHIAAAQHYLTSQATVEKIAVAANVRDPERFAKRWIVLIQGAVTHRMVAGDDDAAKTAKHIAELVLEAALGAG